MCGRATHWRSELTDDSLPGEETWTHLFVQLFDSDDPRLDLLLRLVADWVTSGVILSEPAWSWIYHPYDGGADVFAADRAQRDLLAERHADWLSARPDGL